MQLACYFAIIDAFGCGTHQAQYVYPATINIIITNSRVAIVPGTE